MINLLRTEWLKVRNYNTFWVLSVLYIVSIFGGAYISYLIYESRPKNDKGVADAIIGKPFDFPDVWHMVSFTSSLIMFMLGLLIIISLTNEFSYKTHRQNIIDGWSRKEFILVKMILTVVVSLFATIAVFFTAVFFGLQQDAPFTFEKIEYIGYFFIQALSYSSAALLFSLLFKRSGITIGVYFLYTTIIENVLAGFLNKYIDNLGRYLPLETTDNLIRIPVFKVVVSQLTQSYNTELQLFMSVVYLSLYYFICYRKFQTDDL